MRAPRPYNFPMKNSLKLAFLFVGTVIGAGFATGREIALYFQGYSPLTAAAAGLLLGALCTLFCIFPSGGTTENSHDSALRKAPSVCSKLVAAVSSAGILFAATATSAAMLAGAEELLHEVTGLPLFGTVFLAVAALSVAFGIEKIKILNLLTIPVLAVFVMFLYIKSGDSVINGKIGLTAPFSYAALNIFLAGALFSKMKATKKEAIGAGVISGGVLFVLLFCLQNLTTKRSGFSMPVFAAATELGVPAIGGAVISIAIFTTLLSSLKLAADELKAIAQKSRRLQAFFPQNDGGLSVLLAATPAAFLALCGFENLVRCTYPVISVFGFVSLAVLAAHVLRGKKQKNRPKRRLYTKKSPFCHWHFSEKA